MVLRAAFMPIVLLWRFSGASCTVQHCSYKIYFTVPLQTGPFALWGPNLPFLRWLSLFEPRTGALPWYSFTMFHSKGTQCPGFCGRSTEFSCLIGCLWSTLFFWFFHLNQETNSLCGFSHHVQCREQFLSLEKSFQRKVKWNLFAEKAFEDGVA